MNVFLARPESSALPAPFCTSLLITTQSFAVLQESNTEVLSANAERPLLDDETSALSDVASLVSADDDKVLEATTRTSPVCLQQHPLHIAMADVGGIQSLLYLLGICPPSEPAQCAVLGCLLQMAQEVRVLLLFVK